MRGGSETDAEIRKFIAFVTLSITDSAKVKEPKFYEVRTRQSDPSLPLPTKFFTFFGQNFAHTLPVPLAAL